MNEETYEVRSEQILIYRIRVTEIYKKKKKKQGKEGNVNLRKVP